MYNKQLNDILINRKTKVYIPVDYEQKKLPEFTTSIAFIEDFDSQLKEIGFQMSDELKRHLVFTTLNEEELKEWARDTYNSLSEAIGNNVKHKPMYRNFPEVMKTKTDEELEMERRQGYLYDYLSIINSQILGHEIDLRRLYFTFDETPEQIQEENGTIKTLGFISDEEVNEMFKNMIEQKNSLNEYDKECLRFVFKERDLSLIMPEEIPMKENLVFVYNENKNNPEIIKNLPIKTEVDVLRLAVARDGGDISLGSNHFFNNISRAERRQFLGLMEKVVKENGHNQALEDMERHSEKFKRFAEKLHPGEYQDRYPLINDVFKDLREKEKAKTFSREYEHLLRNVRKGGKENELLELLEKRPGEYARHIDAVISIEGVDKDKVIESFDKVVDRVPTDVLFNLRKHFENRGIEDENKVRLIYPKGSQNLFYAQYDQRERLDQNTIDKLNNVITKGIDLRLEYKEPISENTKVYIDPEMTNILLPSNNRAASAGFKTLSKGSSVPLDEDKNIIRAFLYWEGRDIDLSMGYLDENMKNLGQIAYYDLRDDKNNPTAYHSGDITNAPEGASEFIDVNLKEFKKAHPDAKYLVFTTHVYNGPCFADHDKCFMGIMNRESVNSAEPYDPKTVINKFDISNTGFSSANMMYDIDNNRLYWLDAQIRNYDYDFPGLVQESLNNYENTKNNYSMLVKGIIDSDKANLKEIIEENIKVRGGQLVDSREDADIVVAMDGNLTPFDMEKILVEYVDSNYKNYDELMKLREERFINKVEESVKDIVKFESDYKEKSAAEKLDYIDKELNKNFKDGSTHMRFNDYKKEVLGDLYKEYEDKLDEKQYQFK